LWIDFFGSGQRRGVEFCEHDDELAGYINCKEYQARLRIYWLRNYDSG
jgi:hypothetical protein